MSDQNFDDQEFPVGTRVVITHTVGGGIGSPLLRTGDVVEILSEAFRWREGDVVRLNQFGRTLMHSEMGGAMDGMKTQIVTTPERLQLRKIFVSHQTRWMRRLEDPDADAQTVADDARVTA